MSRVFLTGGSGLVGGALLDRLVRDGEEVVALARSDAAADALAGRGARVVRGDVLDEGALAAGMAGCALAYHVAGMNTMCPSDPAAMFHVNVRGAELAVRAAARAGVPRLVLTSSAASLGEATGTVGTEASPHRGSFLSVYERTKHDGEVAALAAGRATGVEVVSINPSSVQGPGRAGGTGRILIAYLNGKLRAFVATQISIVDIDDCVEGHVLGAAHGRPGERYVLSGATLPAQGALEIVTELSGVRHDVRLLPPVVARAAGRAVEAAFRVRGRTPPVCREMVRTLLHGHRYDGSRATRELGLRYTPVRETFRRTITWAAEAGLVDPGVAAFVPGYTPGMSEHDDETTRARPEQGPGDDGFAEGQERGPATPDEELGPDFARGQAHERTTTGDAQGRFSEGQEEDPGAPQVERDFAEGQEQPKP